MMSKPAIALLKTSEGPSGEVFWIVRVDVDLGNLERTRRSLNVDSARASLIELGCSPSEIDELLEAARERFNN